MNWQLLKNVNVPIGKLLLLFYPDQTVRFAMRSENGKNLYIADSFTSGELADGWIRMNYGEYKAYRGHEIFWTLFVKP